MRVAASISGRVRDNLTRNQEALVQLEQVRLGEGVHAQARRLADRAHEGDGGAFAVGAGDVDDRWEVSVRRAKRMKCCVQRRALERFAVTEFGAE